MLRVLDSVDHEIDSRKGQRDESAVVIRSDDLAFVAGGLDREDYLVVGRCVEVGNLPGGNETVVFVDEVLLKLLYRIHGGFMLLKDDCFLVIVPLSQCPKTSYPRDKWGKSVCCPAFRRGTGQGRAPASGLPKRRDSRAKSTF